MPFLCASQCVHTTRYALTLHSCLFRKLVYVRAAGPLTVTVLSIAISNIFKLYKAPHNIAIVGVIPQVS